MPISGGSYTLPTNAFAQPTPNTRVQSSEAVATLTDIEAALDQLVDGTGLAADSVTFAKIVNMAEARVLGRAVGAGTGDIGELTGAQVRTVADLDNTTRQVASRAVMDDVDGTKFPVVYLTEAGREGLFRWTSANISTFVTNDPQQGLYVAPASDVTGASGGWVRDRQPRQYWVSWFGASTAAVDSAPAIQAAINFATSEFGGSIYFSGYYRVDSGIVINGNDIKLFGTENTAGMFTNTAGKQLLKISGSRNGLYNLILHYNVFTSTTSDWCLWLENGAKFTARDCRFYGGYHPLALTGTGISDTVWDNCTFDYTTGPAQVYTVRTDAGLNGGHHFRRCLFNLTYPVLNPTSSSQFKGAWASATAYSVGDLVTVRGGLYYLQCRTVTGGATSGATEPFGVGTEVWYGINIVDNNVTWRLCSRADLVGVRLDTGTSYIYISNCDVTGPFYRGFVCRNTFAGDVPEAIYITECTVHGPLNTAVELLAVNQAHISALDSFSPIFSGSIGVDVTSGAEDVNIERINLRGFTDGVNINGPKVRVAGSTIIGGGTGVRVKAGVSGFRIIDNNVGSRTVGGANTTGVVVEVGASNNYTIAHNTVSGAGTGVTDGGTGLNKTVADNR
jgi:hypothetical protein